MLGHFPLITPQNILLTAGFGRTVRLPERGHRARGRFFVMIDRL